MRLRSFPAGALLASLVPDGREAADRGPSQSPLLGSWSATRWQYTSRARPGLVADLICDIGGSVTLSLSAGTYILTWDVAGRGDQSIGGTLAVNGDRLELLAQGATAAESLQFHLAAETLSLSCETSSWDFDGSGEEPADFVAVLVRL